MIVSDLANFRIHCASHPAFPTCLDYLEHLSGNEADGAYDLADGVIARFQSYTTKPVENGKFESHRRYIDIQYMLSGQERIGVTPIGSLSPSTGYEESTDLIFYAGTAQHELLLTPGTAAVFHPEDGHMPGIAAPTPAHVRKVVLKVPVV